MANPQLTARVTNCLERLAALCDTLAESTALPADPDPAWLERQRADTANLAALERETAILRAEWDADQTADPSETETVRALSGRAAESVARLAAVRALDQAAARGTIDDIQSELTALREGRAVIGSYRAGRGDRPDQLDRNA
jgi:hypothetical protein